MKTTTFYKLRKPEGTDPVNLEDFNVNFDDIDKALKEAADASGDLSRGKVFATQASERSNFDSGDTLAIGFGKIMKWFSDLKSAAFATLVNNDITTAEGYAADARIVKTHGDEIDALVTKTDNMKASFQAGVDGIYNAITAQGTTPASKSQSDVQAAIPALASSSYNSGFAKCFNSPYGTNNNAYTASSTCLAVCVAECMNSNPSGNGIQYASVGLNTNGSVIASWNDGTGINGANTWYTSKLHIWLVKLLPGQSVTISGSTQYIKCAIYAIGT